MALFAWAHSKVRCRKLHQCVHCGSIFSYAMRRIVTGFGKTKMDAEIAAETKNHKTMERAVDTYPCPQCGTIQPEMLGPRRRQIHWWLFWVGLVTFLATPILQVNQVLEASILLPATAGFFALLTLVQLLVSWHNPNRNLPANLTRSGQAVGRGALKLESTTSESAIKLPSNWARSKWLWLIAPMFLVGLGGMVCAEVVRLINGWPLNSQCHPQVVGPGDWTEFYFPHEIQSILGSWTGIGSVIVENQHELGKQFKMDIQSRQQGSFGGTVKWIEKTTRSARIWAKVTLGDVPEPLGKVVRAKLKVLATFPVLVGPGVYQMQTGQFQRDVEIELAPAKAGALYGRLVGGGTTAGALLFLIGSAWLAILAGRLARKGNPSHAQPEAAKSEGQFYS
jgi:hypothetical protein